MKHHPSATPPFSILVLDDNPSTSSIAKSVLERHLPCSVMICSTPSELRELSSRSAPDLFLLDISLGIDTGIDLCQALKSEPSTQEIPVVFLSTYKEPALRVAALKAGGADYVDKPFYPEELVARVRGQIEVHRLRLENQRQIAEQQALLRVLCHDLINPIFGAYGLLELKAEASDNLDHDLKLALKCCQSAMDIVSHVRQQHSLMAVDKQAEPDSCSISEAFAEAERTLNRQYAKKGVVLRTRIECEAQIPIKRVVLVHSILNNLLTNALKFTAPGGQVELSAKRQLTAGKGERLAIEVRDNGVGMPSEILSRVFDENAKVSRIGTAGESGTGFGMPLVKRYVESAGGAIKIESTVANPAEPLAASGTSVTLAFPARRHEQAARS